MALLLIGFYMSDNNLGDFDIGAVFGVIITILVVIEVGILDSMQEKPSPTAIDVYQGKTTLEYKVVDGIKNDSIVVFRDSIYEK